MIVPRNRLLYWTAALLPAVGLAAAWPETAFLGWALAGLLALTAALDGALSPGRLAGLSVSLPELLRLTKDREGVLEIRVENERRKVRRLRLGLNFPAEVQSEHHDLLVELPKQETSSDVSWPCRGIKRGRYYLDRCYLEVSSGLGFWSARKTVACRAEIRVYPNLMSEDKNLAALFLNRGASGIHAQRQIGKGRDFEQLRDYLSGDGYEDIHWKATAKRGRPVTKVYQLERTQEVYVVIDASRLSGRDPLPAVGRREGRLAGSPEPATLLERFVTAGLILCLAAQRQGDLFGLLTFSDRVRRFVRAKNGKTHYDACREALYTLEPQEVSPDFSEVFTFIATRLRKRALLLILTNLDDPILAESYTQNIQIVSRRHLIMTSMISPPGVRPLFSSPEMSTEDDLYQALGGHMLWSGLRETEKLLRRKNVSFHLLENEKLSAELVTQYLSVKRRQAL
jgi:uncharacterized protein (DUF58 family)